MQLLLAIACKTTLQPAFHFHSPDSITLVYSVIPFFKKTIAHCKIRGLTGLPDKAEVLN
jgi:hypothetical protein